MPASSAMVKAGEHLLHQFHGQRRNMRCREGGRKLSVDTADGIDRKFCKVDNGGRDDNRNQRSRNLVGDFRPEQHDDNGCGAYSGGSPVDGGNICGVGNHFIHEPGRHGCDGESEEILELADKAIPQVKPVVMV